MYKSNGDKLSLFSLFQNLPEFRTSLNTRDVAWHGMCIFICRMIQQNNNCVFMLGISCIFSNESLVAFIVTLIKLCFERRVN